jgi:hypothetical protein
MKDIELLGGVIAAVGHDVGHPAVTNRFIITMKDPLAIIYNDLSVLEMMHCSVTFRVLLEAGLLSSLPQQSWELVRKVVIEMILATDMSKHFDMMGVFRGASLGALDLQTFEERLVLFKMAVKCADVGHAAKETTLHEKWTSKIVEEFFAQGDLEKESHLPISIYCDRTSTDISKSQIGFISAIVQPLFEVLQTCLQSNAIYEDCVRQLQTNMDYWKAKGVKRSNSLTDHNLAEPMNTVATEIDEIKPLFAVCRSKTLIDRRRGV